jgi:hypothetical protein
MITNQIDFCRFAEKKLPLFKIKVSSVLSQRCQFFGENIFEIITSGPAFCDTMPTYLILYEWLYFQQAFANAHEKWNLYGHVITYIVDSISPKQQVKLINTYVNQCMYFNLEIDGANR